MRRGARLSDDKPTEHDAWIGAAPRRDSASRSARSTTATTAGASRSARASHEGIWDDATRADRPSEQETDPPVPAFDCDDNTFRPAVSDACSGPWEDSTTAPGYRGGAPSSPLEPHLATSFGESTELDLDLWAIAEPRPKAPPSGPPDTLTPAHPIASDPADQGRSGVEPEFTRGPPEMLAQFGRIRVLKPRSDGPRAEEDLVPVRSMSIRSKMSAPWRLTGRDTVIVVLVLLALAVATVLTTCAMLS